MKGFLLFLTGAAAVQQHYLGFSELRAGGVGTHAFAWQKDGSHISLQYTAAQRADASIVKLDHWETIINDLQCSASTLRIHTRTSDDRQLLINALKLNELDEDVLIAGGAHWNCSHTGKTTPILRRLESAPRVDELGWLVMRTSEAAHTHFFEGLQLSFSTNMLVQKEPRNQPVVNEVLPLEPAVGPVKQTNRRGLDTWNPVSSIGVALRSSAAAIHELAAKVAQLVSDPAASSGVLADVHPSGSLSLSKLLNLVTWAWNYEGPLAAGSWSNETAASVESAATSIRIDSSVSCTDCFAVASGDLSFTLDIAAFELQEASMLLTGSAKLQAATTLLTHAGCAH